MTDLMNRNVLCPLYRYKYVAGVGRERMSRKKCIVYDVVHSFEYRISVSFGIPFIRLDDFVLDIGSYRIFVYGGTHGSTYCLCRFYA